MTKTEAIEWLEKAKAETTAIAKDIPTTEEYANSLITAIELVDALDMAIEALEREPKRGKWEKVPYKRQGHDEIVIDREAWRCTNCGNAPKINNPYMRYCPNCGAIMESEE